MGAWVTFLADQTPLVLWDMSEFELSSLTVAELRWLVGE
jgi:hypothetical protein